jgi:hypothetical protein
MEEKDGSGSWPMSNILEWHHKSKATFKKL